MSGCAEKRKARRAAKKEWDRVNGTLLARAATWLEHDEEEKWSRTDFVSVTNVDRETLERGDPLVDWGDDASIEAHFDRLKALPRDLNLRELLALRPVGDALSVRDSAPDHTFAEQELRKFGDYYVTVCLSNDISCNRVSDAAPYRLTVECAYGTLREAVEAEKVWPHPE